MKLNLLMKSLLTMPALLGARLALTAMPSLAEGEPSVVKTTEVQTLQTLPPVTPESEPLVPSTQAAELQTVETPTVRSLIEPSVQSSHPQLSVLPIATSDDTKVAPTVNLDEVAVGLSTSASTVSFPASPVLDQMLLASQDLIGCRVPGIICPSPNPAQYANPPGSTPSTGEPISPGSAPSEPVTTKSDRWHVLFTPFVYVPIAIYGNATVKGFNADVSLGPSDVFSSIRNTLQFAFFGRTEAWTPNYRLGFILGGSYIAVGQNNTFTRPNPDRLVDAVINRVANQLQNRLDESQRQRIADLIKNSGLDNGQIKNQIEQIVGQRLNEIIPTQVRSDVKVQNWSIDLAAAYRFYNPSQVNPKGVTSEFDLGPFVFDVFGGLRFGGTSGEVDVTSNLGGEGNFSNSVFTIVPMIGVRLRYNASHNLALVAAGSTGGFGIDTLWQWDAIGGLDWMFSGNTSLSVGWRFAGISYETGSGQNEFGVNLNNNGPYLNVTFRF